MVVHAVQLFGSETWVMTAAMPHKLEGVHLGFLRKVTGMKARRLWDEIWKKEGAYRAIQAVGTKPIWEYIIKNHLTVVEWLALWPIFEVCAKDTVYEGAGRLN